MRSDGGASVRTIVKGKNIEIPDRVRVYAERKLARLERVLDDRSDALVDLSVEQHRSAADSHIVDVTLMIDGTALRGHAAGASFQEGIDIVVDKVERRAVDYKRKPRLRARSNQERQLLRRIADGTAEPGRDRRIVKTKRFALEPMFEEDAISEMEDLGHSFFLFVDAETEHLALLYRRDDGDYGLIQPSVGGEYTSPRNGRGYGRASGESSGTGSTGASRDGPRSATGTGRPGRRSRAS